MSVAHLFTALCVGNLELGTASSSRQCVQYSAEQGCATDWHLIHLGHLALSGAALLTIEATAVVPKGVSRRETSASPRRDGGGARAHPCEHPTLVRHPCGHAVAQAGARYRRTCPGKAGRRFRRARRTAEQTVAPSAVPFAEDSIRRSPSTRRPWRGRARRLPARLNAPHASGSSGPDSAQHRYAAPVPGAFSNAANQSGVRLEARMCIPLEVSMPFSTRIPTEKAGKHASFRTDSAEGGWNIEQTSRSRKPWNGAAAAPFTCRAAG